jgi:hypothetical protein
MSLKKQTWGEAAATGTYDRLPISDLLLDSANPRLAEYGITDSASQFDLLKTLWVEMAVEEVAASIAHSGFFEHEPLFVEKTSSGKYVVIEGNRRLAAVKLLVDADLRNKLRATDLPRITQEQAAALADLPVIVTSRREVWRYLGFKHVNGPATWGSYAKAQYIAFVHNNYHVPLEDIAAQIGDYNATVERMYRGLMIVEQAEEARVFNRADVSKSRFHFNYIYTGMDYPGIRRFLSLGNKAASSSRPVPVSKVKNLGELLTWLYGSKKRSKKSLIKSQNPDLRDLDSVLLTDDGVKALRDGLPLSVARDISLGDERIFKQSLREAKLAMQRALGTMTTGYEPSETENLVLAQDLESLARDLVDGMVQKKNKGERVARKTARINA